MFGDSIDVVPERCARYAGTSGNTHGDKNDNTPAANAKMNPYGPVKYSTHASVISIRRPHSANESLAPRRNRRLFR